MTEENRLNGSALKTSSGSTRTELRHVLIVDDDPGDVFLIQQALRICHKNVRTDAVGDGIEALKFLRQEGRYSDRPTPHFVFLDLNMPRMNGHETLIELRADETLKSLPVIVLTTSESKVDIRKAYAEQATCFVNKPLELDALTTMVEHLGRFWFDVVRYPD